jgi:hypothetical protein
MKIDFPSQRFNQFSTKGNDGDAEKLLMLRPVSLLVQEGLSLQEGNEYTRRD